MSLDKVKVLVADSGAFIKGVPLHEWSERVVTVREVLGEIRDFNTRQRIQLLPYKLEFKEPTPSAIYYVTEFAKKTGDYRSLSAVDLRVLALVYQLECESGPERGKQLRAEPVKTSTSHNFQIGQSHGTTAIAGFYKGPQNTKLSHEEITQPQSEELNTSEREQGSVVDVVKDKSGVKDIDHLADSIMKVTVSNEEQIGVIKYTEGDDDDDDDDDDDGWITPENIVKVCNELGGGMEESPAGVSVCCVTADYAMQNVLLQIGLNVLSMNGMLVKELRTYALKCTACFKTTLRTVERFCPHCGNKSLVKVASHVCKDGSVQYQLLSERQLYPRRRNTQAPPMHRGGRNPPPRIHAPDVKVTFSMPRSRDNKVNPLDPEYITRGSPFRHHDTTSKGAQLMFGLKRARGKANKRK